METFPGRMFVLYIIGSNKFVFEERERETSKFFLTGESVQRAELEFLLGLRIRIPPLRKINPDPTSVDKPDPTLQRTTRILILSNFFLIKFTFNIFVRHKSQNEYTNTVS